MTTIAVAEATTGRPVEHTPALCAALDRLLASAKGDAWPFDQFWNTVGNPLNKAWSATEASNVHHAQCHVALRGTIRLVGYRDDIERCALLMVAARSATAVA